jgi:hypothetical protein
MKQPQTTRLAFIYKNDTLYEKEFTFDFFGGFAVEQKQRTIDKFHNEIKLSNPALKILEVSRKSKNPLGPMLSAFNLTINLNGRPYSVESIYQSSKVFSDQIQFLECMFLPPMEAKKKIQEEIEKAKLEIIGFRLLNVNFPLIPNTIFYDYLYLLGLSQNRIIADQILKYDVFTDIEFNHKRQFASQARSCAIFKHLSLRNQLNSVLQDYLKLKEVYNSIISNSQGGLTFY